MIKNLRHSAIVVNDLQKCREFYESFLGCTLAKSETETGPFIEKVVGIKGVILHWVKLKTPNGIIIELLKYEYPSTPFEPGIQTSNKYGHSHMAFTIHSMDEFVKAFKARNGHFVNEPDTNPEGTVKVCYVHDPEGNLLEIVQEL